MSGFESWARLEHDRDPERALTVVGSERGGNAERLAKWFALVVKPRHEKAVSRILETKGYEIFVPLQKTQHRYDTRLREFELPLFQGYIFCRFDLSGKLPVLTTPGVTRILGAGRVPVPVDDVEIASLQTVLKAQVPVRPFPFLSAGRKVRIAEGSLAGVEGIVVSFRHPSRLVLSITLLQRSVLLEIDRGNVIEEEVLRSIEAQTLGG